MEGCDAMLSNFNEHKYNLYLFVIFSSFSLAPIFVETILVQKFMQIPAPRPS